MVLINVQKKTVVSDHCHFAGSALKRMVGLLNRTSLAQGEGLLIDRCYGIHTFFMRFPIDVLFLDKDYRVMKAVRSLPPWRTSIVKQAVYVLELPPGTINLSHTAEGDQIQLRATAPQQPPPFGVGAPVKSP